MSFSSIYKKIFSLLPETHLILDETLTILDVNFNHLAEILNSDVIGKNIFSLYENKIDNDDFLKLTHSLKQVLLDEKSQAIDIKLTLPPKIKGFKNSELILKIINTPIVDEDNNKYILHSITDMTKYFLAVKIGEQRNALTEKLIIHAGEMEKEVFQYIKKLEEKNIELTQMNEELANIDSVKSRLATIVEATDEAIITESLDGIIEQWNSGAEKLYGYQAEEVIGKSSQLIFPETKINEHRLAKAETKKGLPLNYWNTQRKHKHGHLISVSIRIYPIKDPQTGMIDRYCSIAHDISEYNTARSLKIKNEELLELSNLKNCFIANVSHELRTPLHGIIGFSKLLLNDAINSLTDKQKEYIDFILLSGNHLNVLINDVLDLTKIDAGKLELNLETINIPNLIKEVNNLFKNSMNQKNIEFLTFCDDKIPAVYSDYNKLKQIINNYLSNAIKFTPSGGKIQLDIKMVQPDKFCLSVKDTGIGVCKSNLNKLFTEFQQLDGSITKEYQGTGLGLAIVKRLAALLGGEAKVESEKGQGSTFSVILPANLNQLKLPQ